MGVNAGRSAILRWLLTFFDAVTMPESLRPLGHELRGRVVHEMRRVVAEPGIRLTVFPSSQLISQRITIHGSPI
jgi:hypothetical protein